MHAAALCSTRCTNRSQDDRRRHLQGYGTLHRRLRRRGGSGAADGLDWQRWPSAGRVQLTVMETAPALAALALHDRHAEPVEGAPLGGIVRLMAARIAVAHADHSAGPLTAKLTLLSAVGTGRPCASTIDDVDDRHVLTVRRDPGAVRRRNDLRRRLPPSRAFRSAPPCRLCWRAPPAFPAHTSPSTPGARSSSPAASRGWCRSGTARRSPGCSSAQTSISWPSLPSQFQCGSRCSTGSAPHHVL